jgi:hypothetical protein
MASFELRTATAEDLDEWGAVAAAAFAYKGGDPRRFRWNYDADPTSTPSDIYVCRGCRTVQWPLGAAATHSAELSDVCAGVWNRGNAQLACKDGRIAAAVSACLATCELRLR